MDKLKFILDAGHGGATLAAGYVTPGKRSPDGVNGIIYEGLSNRAFVHDIAFQLALRGRDVEIVSDTAKDVSLGIRAFRANQAAQGKECLFVSFHSNAAIGVFGPYTGFEIFTYLGEDESDRYAELIGNLLSAKYQGIKWRKESRGGNDGPMDKDKDLGVLRNLDKGVPGVLFECLFMDGSEDYMKLTDPIWRANFVTNFVEVLCAL